MERKINTCLSVWTIGVSTISYASVTSTISVYYRYGCKYTHARPYEQCYVGFARFTLFLVFRPSIIITLLFLVVFISGIIRRRRLENAIFEIRDLLQEIRDSQPKL